MLDVGKQCRVFQIRNLSVPSFHIRNSPIALRLLSVVPPGRQGLSEFGFLPRKIAESQRWRDSDWFT